MDDLSEKLSGILSDPDAMREVAALASQLGLDTSGLHSEPEPPPSKESAGAAAMLGALAPVLSSVKQEDDTIRLLDAVRPFLSEERKLKLDKAKRLIKVMKLMPLLKDLPLFDL